MTTVKQSRTPLIIVALIAAVAGYVIRGDDTQLTQQAIANRPETVTPSKDSQASKPSSVQPTADRGVYYPGTEELKPDEIRVICTGSGMPMPRLKQAAANGLFMSTDMSTGHTHFNIDIDWS